MYRVDTYNNKIVYITNEQLQQEIKRFEGETTKLTANGYRFSSGGNIATATKCPTASISFYNRKEKKVNKCTFFDPITLQPEAKWNDKKFMRLHGSTLPPSIKILADIHFEGISSAIINHLWDYEIKYEELNNGPALSYKSTISKTGKVIKRIMPVGTPDNVIQTIAATINKHNTFFKRKKELMDFRLLSGLKGAEESDKLGSCMHGKGLWKNIDSFTHLSPTDVDLSKPPPKDCGPYTILWNNITDKKLSGGCGKLRVFLWPVEINGKREWYLDRVYPSTGAVSQTWLQDWADAVGFRGSEKAHYGIVSLFSDTKHPSKHPLVHHLRKKVVHSKPLPWLDTFARTNKDETALLTPSAADVIPASNLRLRTTSGAWR